VNLVFLATPTLIKRIIGSIYQDILQSATPLIKNITKQRHTFTDVHPALGGNAYILLMVLPAYKDALTPYNKALDPSVKSSAFPPNT